MPSFRRWYRPGGMYFFTVVTHQRKPLFSHRAARQLLGSAMREVRRESPFKTFAIVLLWDPLHCVWALPQNDDDYSNRWKDIKSQFTQVWLETGGTEGRVTRAQERRGNRGVWQMRFWEHMIRDEEDLERCCNYIHYNPVKHGYVQRPWDWPWSSFRRHVEAGQYPWDWGQTEPSDIQGIDWE